VLVLAAGEAGRSVAPDVPATPIGAGLSLRAEAGSFVGATGRATPRWLPRGSSGWDESATRNPRGHGAMPETEAHGPLASSDGPATISAYTTVEGRPPAKHLTQPSYPVRLWMDVVSGTLIMRCAGAVDRTRVCPQWPIEQVGIWQSAISQIDIYRTAIT
jgi:hypothetical protein